MSTIDERDLYLEIEAEISSPPHEGGQGFLAFALTLFSLSLISLACVAGWIFLSEQGAVPSVAAMIYGTATATTAPPTPVPTVTPTSVPTLLPTAVEEQAEQSPAVAVATATPQPTATTAPTATPVPSPTATTIAWIPEVSPPLLAQPSSVQLSIEEAGGRNPMSILTYLGYSGESYVDELRYIRAQTPDYLGDTSVRGSAPLAGALPASPLYLFVGQMDGPAEFNGDSGLLRLRVPWSETTIEATLPPELLRQTENPSLVVNTWPAQSGWIVLLAQSADLTQALAECRNTLPSQNNRFAMPTTSRSCGVLNGQFSVQLPVEALIVLGLELNGNSLTPLLPLPPAPLINRWIFADLGSVGLQLVTSSYISGAINSSRASLDVGLVRATWNPEQLQLDITTIFDAELSNISAGESSEKVTYRLLWKTE